MAEQENSTGKGKKLVDLDGPDPKKKTTTSASTPAATNPGAKAPAASAPPAPLIAGVGAPKQTQFQKSQHQSAFQTADAVNAKAKLANSIGTAPRAPLFSDDDDEPTAIGAAYDGITPANELSNRDLWKAVQAPVQSREGRRSIETYRMVINQFAVGHNPRYEPDGPDKPRGHIFVWDVSRAMNCEIPHFVGPREMSLGQTVDWLRNEGPMRGWMRASLADAHSAALDGMLAVLVPKDVKLKQMAVIVPEQELAPDGKPFVACAGKQRGNKLKLGEALGVHLADCFVHP